MRSTPSSTAVPVNSAATVLFASLVGTTIEFFDFYIFATASVLVFPKLFFPSADPTVEILKSLLTFALAFFARPIGSAVFGHFGDRVGRKATLVAALLTMGLSTVCIGLLPVYESIGVAAPMLLALCRFGQGLGLGGEWGGAVLLATENAPEGRRAWYGMFPQLGAPLGFLMSSGIFLLLGQTLTAEQFLAFGWRIPFLASALLVFMGMYVRLRLHETPSFAKALQKNERVAVPFMHVLTRYPLVLLQGTVAAIATFVVFYLMTVFALSWGTSSLHYAKADFLVWQMVSMLPFAIGVPLSALVADKIGRRTMLMLASAAILAFGLGWESLFMASNPSGTVLFLCIGMFLMGLTYGPLGTALSELFPTSVRYTGASLTFNLAGIFGASLAPFIATTLARDHGLAYVGYYMSAAAVLSLVALLSIGKRADASFSAD